MSGTTPGPSKRLKTAKEKQSQDIDLEALKELKKSLICAECKRFPRPGSKVWTCELCDKIVCSKCADGKTEDDYLELECDCDFEDDQLKEFRLAGPIISKLISLFKFHPCLYFKNGCEDEFDAEELEDHEKSCLFRTVTCPYDLIELDHFHGNPIFKACSEEFPFYTFLDHYENAHPNAETKNEVLKFKGTIEQLKTKTFILKSYGRPFFPQFYVNGNMLHFWIIGHCDEIEANMFEASISFFYNGKWNQLGDTVKPIDIKKGLLKNGESGLTFPVETLTQYFDRQNNVRKNSDEIEFKLEIICEKLDEVAKDQNVESGVDSDDERK